MEWSTLYRGCFWFCVAITVITLSISFVSGTEIFGEHIEMGIDTSGNSTTVFTQLSGLTGGLEYMWGLAVGVGLAITSVIAYATHSTTPIGIYLFATIFWTSYSRGISIVQEYIPDDFLLIGTVAMLFLFTGAVIGMLSGSG